VRVTSSVERGTRRHRWREKHTIAQELCRAVERPSGDPCNIAPISIQDASLSESTFTRTDPEFDKYVAALPSYLWPFLTNIEWSTCPTTCAQRLVAMSSDVPVLLVSNGSSIDGTILARFQGKAMGQPSSHQAKASGTLAGALLLLTHLALFTRQTFSNLSVTACCDNQSVIAPLTDQIHQQSRLRGFLGHFETMVHHQGQLGGKTLLCDMHGLGLHQSQSHAVDAWQH
jgi:hypothetical protein